MLRMQGGRGAGDSWQQEPGATCNGICWVTCIELHKKAPRVESVQDVEKDYRYCHALILRSSCLVVQGILPGDFGFAC